MVENDQSQELRELELPGDATNVRSFAVETLFNYFAHFGAVYGTGCRNLEIVFDDQDLTFAERVWHPGKING